jgi:predicted nicotinamide N-methyase
LTAAAPLKVADRGDVKRRNRAFARFAVSRFTQRHKGFTKDTKKFQHYGMIRILMDALCLRVFFLPSCEPVTSRRQGNLRLKGCHKRLNPTRFIRDHTQLLPPPHVPELRLHLASEVFPLWHLTEEELEKNGVPPPYWAFAWAGGQALARYVLDHPDTVAGRYVLDFAAGSGLVGIAAAKAGAARVLAAEVDVFAAAACRLNASANGVTMEVCTDDLIGTDSGWRTVLAGDVCYEEPMAGRVTEWLAGLAGQGVTVLIGDPGRNFLPRERLEPLARYRVPVSRELEDSEVRDTAVWRFRPVSV